MARDIAACNDRGDEVNIVLPQAFVRLNFRVDTDSVCAPLLLQERECVIFDAVANPAFGATSHWSVTACHVLADKVTLLAGGPCSSAAIELKHLIALDLDA